MSELLQYKRAGTGPTLVLVHGFFGGSDQWSREIDSLQNRYDVIAVDLPGFGNSAHMLPCRSIKSFAQAIIDLLDELKVGRFALLGHSMGGMIVQEIAFLAKDRVAKLILYGTGPIGAMPSRFETHETSRQRLQQDGLKESVRRISAQWFLQGADSPQYAECVNLGLKSSKAAGMAGLEAMEAWDGRDHLHSLRNDTQIIWGEYDRSYGFAEQEQLWREQPNCSMAIVPRASHMVHLEQSKIFLAIIEEFLLCTDKN